MMSVEERLARIEEKMTHVVDGLSSLNQGLEKIIIPRLADLERKVQECELARKDFENKLALAKEMQVSETRMQRLLLAVATLLGVGGGGAGLATRFFGAP